VHGVVLRVTANLYFNYHVHFVPPWLECQPEEVRTQSLWTDAFESALVIPELRYVRRLPRDTAGY
jgi:hypothetical protein